MSAHFDRALLLFDQSRYDLAEQELRQALGDEPNDPSAHALLAMCISRRKDHSAAIETAERAVGLAPDLPFAHYALANALHVADRENEAAVAIEQAISLDPFNPSFHGMQASIRFARRDWAGALDAADAGLRLDPQDDTCTNLRAMALVQLGRRDEAGAAIHGALERDPENAVSHANQGWTLLHERRPKEALEHFREALRIDPTLDWARAGMVEALKARHLVYRLMLSFFLWSGRLGRKMQWVLILGIFFGQRALGRLARNNPALAPFIDPIVYAIFGFVLLTWTAGPLFNLVLRFNRFGRHALSREQVVASNWLAACLLITAAVFVTGLVGPFYFPIYATIPCLVLSAAVAGVFNVRSGWPRALLAAWVFGLAFLVVRMNWYAWNIERHFPAPMIQKWEPLFKEDLGMFVMGGLLYFIVVNALGMTRPQVASGE